MRVIIAKSIFAVSAVYSAYGTNILDHITTRFTRPALYGLVQEPAPVAFEVAAIRQSVTGQLVNDIQSGNRRAGTTITDARVSFNQMSLAQLIRQAFRIEPYQLIGPSWLDELRFDIQATIPAGVNRDRVPEMLQGLLAARFDLVVHRESRELSAFALVVGKDGPKLGEALPETDVTSTSAERNQNRTGSAGNQPQSDRSSTGRGDFGVVTQSETSTMTFKPGPNGSIQTDVSRMTMVELAQTLTAFAGRPVVDRTELVGAYHVTLEVTGTEVTRLMGLTRNAGGSSAGDNAPASLASEPPGQSSIVRSVEKLGLELRSRRMPIGVLIVDKISRTPTTN